MYGKYTSYIANIILMKPMTIVTNPMPIEKTEIRDALLTSSFFLKALNDAIIAETAKGMIISTFAKFTYNGPVTIVVK